MKIMKEIYWTVPNFDQSICLIYVRCAKHREGARCMKKTYATCDEVVGTYTA